jgi:hypothetical protein
MMATHYKLTADGPEVSKEVFDAHVAEVSPPAEADPSPEAPDHEEE